MRYKEDWEKAKKRLTAFWDQEIIDRCCVKVNAVSPQYYQKAKLQRPKNEAEYFQYWTDPEWVLKANRLEMEHTYYGGEAFPIARVGIGACGQAGYFKGAKAIFSSTIWFTPTLTDLEEEELEFDKNSFLYQRTLELARALAADSGGDYMIAHPPICGNADALQHLMGPEALFFAMMEEPEAVKKALDKMEVAYESMMLDFYDIVRDVNQGGSCNRFLTTWAPQLGGQMQCDLSVMISNAQFKEFIMPELEQQCKFLKYPMYHLDGEEQMRHLDDLLSLPALRAIQWTQVAGQPPCTEYLPVLKKIQEAGKSLIIIVHPDQIKPLMENLSSRGLYLQTTVSDRETADAILKEVERLTHE